MIEYDMSRALEGTIRDALKRNVVVIEPQNSLRILHPDTLQQASAEILAALTIGRCEDIAQKVLQECGLSRLLTEESLRDWLQYVVQSLRSRALSIQLHEIRTEVLLSLSSDLNSSNSSSVQDGESVGELPTPSRLETVAATGDTKEAARTHGGAA